MNNLEQLLNTIDQTQIGPEERALIEGGIAEAVEAADEAAEYELRMRLTSSAYMSGDVETALTNFAWCLGKFDADPTRFPQKVTDHIDLFWHYKWMPGAMAKNPRWDRELILSYLDDTEARYRRAGVGLSGVWQGRMGVAMKMGDIPEALRCREERAALPTDDYSHCEACVRAEDADLYAMAGDEERSLAAFDEIIEGNFSCGDEPEAAQGSALLRLLRSGREEEAQAHHLKALRMLRANPDPFHLVPEHLVYCAVTGNEARGLGLLERYLLGVASSPINLAGRFRAVRAFAVLLDAVARAGFGDTTVRGTDAPQLVAVFGERSAAKSGAGKDSTGTGGADETSGEWTVAALAAACWGVADRLAADFDRRNGNDYFSGLVAQSHALADESWDLPLGEVFVPDKLAQPKEPATASEWMSLSRQRLQLMGDPQAALEAADAGLALAPDPALHSLAIHSLLMLDRIEDAEKRLADRVAELRADGRRPRADMEERVGLRAFGRHSEGDREALNGEVERARGQGVPAEVLIDALSNLAGWLMANDETDDGVAAMTEAVALARAEGSPEQLVDMVMMYASVLLGQGERELATESVDELLAGENDVTVRITALRWRAQLQAAAGELAEALTLADEVQELQAGIGNRFGVVDAAILAASILSNMDRDAEAAARMQVALRHAQLGGATQIDGLFFDLGTYQQWSGQHEAAMETFGELLSQLEATDTEPALLAKNYLWLAMAARSAGELNDSYRAYSQCLAHAEQAQVHAFVYQASLGRGQLLFEVDDADAVDDLKVAVESANLVGDESAVATATHWLGRARCAAGDEGGLADLDTAREYVLAEGQAFEAADALDSKGRALISLDRFDEGVALLISAADEMAAVGAIFPALSVEVTAARLLVQREQVDRAVAVYQSALLRVQPGDGPFQMISFELGDALESLGRTAEAATVRATAE